MATPTATVQFRDPEDLLAFYREEGIPAFGIKQKGSLNFKYEGDDLNEGMGKLAAILKMLIRNKTAAIYAFCQYANFTEEITDKTPCSLSNNFRFSEYGESIGGFEGSGANSEIMKELKEMRREIEELKAEKEENPGGMGVIGKILENEAMQPIVLALAGKLADIISGVTSKQAGISHSVGDLKRVSGVPGWHGTWKEDPEVLQSLETLADHLNDFPDVMAKLARMALNKPLQFNIYMGLFRKMNV